MEVESLLNSNFVTVATTKPFPPSSNKPMHVVESLKLKHQFLKVPLEHLKKTMHANHCTIKKEMKVIIASIADGAISYHDMSKEEVVHYISCLFSKLQGLN